MGTPSEDLQGAVYRALILDGAVSAVVGSRVSDGRPGEFPAITFGPSDYVPDDMDCISGRVETLQIDCWVRDGSGRISPARALADKVKAALHGAYLSLDTHALALLTVAGVRAFMDADGLTGHGVVTLEAVLEER